MRSSEFIMEISGGSWRIIRGLIPEHWPDYVVKDALYTRIQNLPDLKDKKQYVQQLLKDYPVKQWRLEIRNFDFKSFTEATQRQLVSRMRGEPEHWEIHRDQERHQNQANIIKKTGAANQEPIIVFTRSSSHALELIEGWHRTIQNLQAFPEGWRGRAWVGYI